MKISEENQFIEQEKTINEAIILKLKDL